MRAVTFVKRVQWDLPGTVCRHGLSIGDVDNDGDNELVVGTTEGELYIFKGMELWQKITGLGLITSVAIGDIFNYGRNALLIVCGDGWVHIFYSPKSVNINQQDKKLINLKGNIKIESKNETTELSGKMECVHVQRIPTNTKIALIADVDKDGANEMIIGLTDRVVRSYRWCSNTETGTGKLVGLNKWECANQIGTVTLQHTADGTPTLLVAQPGGTFMRIKCNANNCNPDDESHNSGNEAAASCVDYETLGISRMRNQNISTEIIGDLKSAILPIITPSESKVPKSVSKESLTKQKFVDDTKIGLRSFKSENLETKRNFSYPEMRNSSFEEPDKCNQEKIVSQSPGVAKFYTALDSPDIDQVDGNFIGGNIILGEFNPEATKKSLLPAFKDFSINDDKDSDNSNNENTGIVDDNDMYNTIDEKAIQNSKPYALATLDGTIMLVKDEIILWSMQVDHQIFALYKLDVTGNGFDEIVACAWDGQTYILDQNKNSVRFQFEEPVRAFCAGIYNVTPRSPTPCLVYNTFHNKIFLYFDVTLPSMTISPLNPTLDLTDDERKILDSILGDVSDVEREQKMQMFNEWLMYGNS